MKYVIALILTMICAVANATPQGVSYVTGTTSSSTAVTIATRPSSQYLMDFDLKIINPNAAGVTGNVIITQGGVTVENASPAPVSGGWLTTGWNYSWPSSTSNNYIILQDVQGIGVQYRFRIWTGTSRNGRP